MRKAVSAHLPTPETMTTSRFKHLAMALLLLVGTLLLAAPGMEAKKKSKSSKGKGKGKASPPERRTGQSVGFDM